MESKVEINSVEYWNHRFETDWNDFGGDKQTIFFANTLCNMLPQWLIDEVTENGYSVCDLGCADGDAVPIWNDIFKKADVCGEDFAENAIKNARKKYPEFMYLVSDIMHPEEKRQYDVVISSNTVEHFKNTEEVLGKICRRSKKYTLVMLPYREDESVTDEHEVKFHTDNIPQIIGNNVLVYARTCLCNSQYYPGEQILLIYEKNPQKGVLSSLVEYVNSDAYKEVENEKKLLQGEYANLENEKAAVQGRNVELESEKAALVSERQAIEERNAVLENEKASLESERQAAKERTAALENQRVSLENEKALLESEKQSAQNRSAELENEKALLESVKQAAQDRNAELEAEKAALESERKAAEERTAELENEKALLEGEKLAVQEKNIKLESEKAFLEGKIKAAEKRNTELEIQKSALEDENQTAWEQNAELENKILGMGKEQKILKENIKSLEKELERSKLLLESSENKRTDLESRINRAILMCNELTNWGLYKFSHMLHRTKHQLFNKSGTERKQYISWITNYLRGNGTDSDRRFKPVYRIADILKGQGSETYAGVGDSQLGIHLQEEGRRLDDGNADMAEVNEIRKILQTRKCRGILVYPHVVYWEPLQTPQQLLRSFARLGWLCFFCEHPNLKDIFREVEENVIIVHEKEFLYAVSDQEVVVLLTWLGSGAFVDRIKNKRIWYHILDKLSLFPYYDDSYMKLHNSTVDSADCVSYVAALLSECIIGREDAIYLPNGVNPDEFINVHENFIPEDMVNIVGTGHKIIGYYGYLAEWMDYEMVRRLALARPGYEFVFIGKAIYDTSLFDGISNIHLLGLKPYSELSDYAKLFDIATIPFVVNETMDCVSPIKFYEYCALGLPVITSKMREMEKYVCEYVACVDGYDEFLFYMDKLTDGRYKEMAGKNAPQIAEDNTWLARAKTIQADFNKELGLLLGQDYTKFDVIILGVIDYDFRFQRPQQLAVRYAQNGHRVFYLNANHFNENSVHEIQRNLYIVNIHNDQFSAIHLTDWEAQKQELTRQVKQIVDSYCIRDAVTIADYPNWIHAAEYLRKEYGFKIITDYMDDYTGFLNPAEELVRQNCQKLLRLSDGVVASSDFLYDIALKYNENVSIIRNGTEFEHFHTAYGTTEHERKVIGYYGAVAEWFQAEKAAYLAKNLPECDIVVIGHLTKGGEVLGRHRNIKLLGEKPYSELPGYLKDFDVCIIPFDTTTDLIKATNPVKFYEYLSAGKKIVATEIPELEEYRDKYVYMANDNEKFLEYVKMCISGTDTLCNAEECVRFARQHDWQERYEKFYEYSRSIVPKIDIIVLTYNNLEINKLCMRSILEKTAYPNYELIVVDNCSTDGTREYLTRMADGNPKVKVILNEKNIGFAAGNNVGMKRASGEYIVLMNNDTVVTRGWLTALAKHMENNSSLGMCGPVTNSIGNEAKIQVNYHSMGELEKFSYAYTTEHLNEEYRNINVLALFCTMIRRQVTDQCGYLDETYGVGMFEDDDYAEMVKSKGYSLAIAEDAFIHHFEGVSFKKLEDAQFMGIFNKNKELFEKKWNKKWTAHKKRQGVSQMTNIDCTIM